MKRLIFCPQLPIKLRYTEWWITEFEKKFQEYYDEVIILGKTQFIELQNNGIEFAPIEKSIKFEQIQIDQYMNLKLDKNDTLFLSDISFPGFFSNILYHKKIDNMYAFCHGTSKNSYDYFQKDRNSKYLIEEGHSKLFKKIFVATNYHKKKLSWNNIKVIGLPQPPFECFNHNKENNIISVSRNCIQKKNKKLEKRVISYFGNIIHKSFSNWNEYYQFISKSKILLSSSKEETFGYQIMDAVNNNCIPIAPNKFSYPELLPKEYLYNNEHELIYKIGYYLNQDNYKVPKLLNQNLIDNFYNNLIHEMII